MSKALVPSHLLVPAGTGNLDAYIQEVYKIPVLTLEEEKELAVQIRQELEAKYDLKAANINAYNWAKIVNAVADEKTNIRNVEAKTFETSEAQIVMVVTVVDRKQMERVMGRIRRIKGVRAVSRALS